MDETHLKNTTGKVIRNLGFCFLVWLFGILIILPLIGPSTAMTPLIVFILLVAIAFAFARAVPALISFANTSGESMLEKRKTWIDQPQPFVHIWYAVWLIVAAILFVPYLFLLNAVIAGIILFGIIFGIGFLVLINFEYIGAYYTRTLQPTQQGPPAQQG